MKCLFLLWITARSVLDAALWATALWCLLYSFAPISWPEYFGVFAAIHLLGNLSSLKYLRTHTRWDCWAFVRRESVLVGLYLLCAPIIAILPAIAAIAFLSYLQAWTNLETHWLHTLLLISCVVYLLLRSRQKRRTARSGPAGPGLAERNLASTLPTARYGRVIDV
jgi:hypothetical protein